MIAIKAENVEGWWSPPPHQRELKILLSPILHDIPNDLSMGMVVLPPGESGDPHTHEFSQEIWFVVSGQGKLIIGSEEVQLSSDMVVVAPAGVEHQIINDSERELKAIFMFTPAGPEENYLPK